MMIELRSSAQTCACLDHNHSVLLKELQRFEDRLLHLRYEGKPRLGKNIKNTSEALNSLTLEIKKHFKLEENIVFPFLGMHVPRLAPVIQLLSSDHQELEKCLRKFKERLDRTARLSRKNMPDCIQQIREAQEIGNFIAQFLNNHLKAEDSIIHNSIKRELRPEEEKKLFSKVYRLMRGRRTRRGKKKK